MTSSNMAVPELNHENIFSNIQAYQLSAALKAAIELDVFTEIARGHCNVEGLAKAVKASIRGVRILCDYLVISKFLFKKDDEYSLTVDSREFLNKDSPAYLGTVTQFLLSPFMTDIFLNRLSDVVRTGKTVLPGEGSVSPDNPLWVDFAKQMASLAFPGAVEIAGKVAGEGEIRVLDIAAGHGLFGIAIAKQNPKAHITALDWPNVLTVATANAERFGVASRHTLLEGSAFDVQFGGPYDLILVTNFFHHFDAPTCEKLMRKIFTALAPGGRCVTFDFVSNDNRVTPPAAAGFALMMLGTTAAGEVFTFAEYETMFRNAGFASSQLDTLVRTPQAVIVSRKASSNSAGIVGISHGGFVEPTP